MNVVNNQVTFTLFHCNSDFRSTEAQPVRTKLPLRISRPPTAFFSPTLAQVFAGYAFGLTFYYEKNSNGADHFHPALASLAVVTGALVPPCEPPLNCGKFNNSKVCGHTFSGCDVCNTCCHSWLNTSDSCDGCVQDECTSGRGPDCCVSFYCDATNGQCKRAFRATGAYPNRSGLHYLLVGKSRRTSTASDLQCTLIGNIPTSNYAWGTDYLVYSTPCSNGNNLFSCTWNGGESHCGYRLVASVSPNGTHLYKTAGGLGASGGHSTSRAVMRIPAIG